MVAKVESADKDGRTTLYTAALKGHVEVVWELLKHGAKMESADNFGYTPLYAAAVDGHIEDIWELLKLGASVKRAHMIRYNPHKTQISTVTWKLSDTC